MTLACSHAAQAKASHGGTQQGLRCGCYAPHNVLGALVAWGHECARGRAAVGRHISGVALVWHSCVCCCFLLEGRVESLAAVRRCILSASLTARRSLSSVPPGLLVSSHPLCFLFLVFDGSSHELFELSVLRQSKYPPRLVSDLCFATISFCYACATEIHKNLDYAPPPPPTGNL